MGYLKECSYSYVIGAKGAFIEKASWGIFDVEEEPAVWHDLILLAWINL